ncbi:MAG: hypothetical protein JNK02_00520 [Planctomycetes bacterium]|nr:hypothetical protein [Planctomycetota bacterium]
MCFFIVLVVPPRLAPGVVERFSAHDLTLEPAALELFTGLTPRSAPLLVSAGGCACGWYRRPRSARSDAGRERARQRYARLGWSNAKIERSLAQARRKPEQGAGLHEVIVELALAVYAATGECGVLVHDYGGRVDQERVEVRARRRVRRADLREQCALMDLDELLEIMD